MRLTFIFVAILSITACSTGSIVKNTVNEKRVLIFSKTDGYRHQSIEAGVEAIKALADTEAYSVDHSEDAELFNQRNLGTYAAVIFLNTTGDILNSRQQGAFKGYIQAGGGFVGVHAATDTEKDWPWYGGLVGAFFESHPQIQEARLTVTDQPHPATAHLPNTFKITDEWYNFYALSTDITPLIMLDESSYEGGTHGENHPASWYQEFDGGRVFYTALGHRPELFQNPLFIEHLRKGINYAVGD